MQVFYDPRFLQDVKEQKFGQTFAETEWPKLEQAAEVHGYRGASKKKHNGIVPIRPSDSGLLKTLNKLLKGSSFQHTIETATQRTHNQNSSTRENGQSSGRIPCEKLHLYCGGCKLCRLVSFTVDSGPQKIIKNKNKHHSEFLECASKDVKPENLHEIAFNLLASGRYTKEIPA